MARIAGVELPPRKPIIAALRYIYGIGPNKSKNIIAKSGVDPMIRAGEISGDDLAKIRNIIEKEEEVEGELRREVQANIKRLKDIGSYRGSRHIKGLPARGQRSKTNSRSVRGNVRKTMGSGKRKLEKT